MPNTDNTKKFISLRRLENFKTLLNEEIDSKLEEVDSKFNVQFTQSDQLENITSGENISTSFGKMSKWFPLVNEIPDIKASKNMLKPMGPGYFSNCSVDCNANFKYIRNGDNLTIHLHSSEAGRLGVILCNTIPPPATLTPENVELYPDVMYDEYVENATDFTLPDLDLSDLPYENMLVCAYFISNDNYLDSPLVTVNDSILLNNKIIINGMEVTYNDNGTITLNGTTNILNYEDAYVYISLGSPSMKSGVSYTLTGCPQGGDDETYCLDLFTPGDSTILMTDFGTGASGTPTANTNDVYVNVYVGPNVQCNNLTFSPMLCTTADYQESPDFKPWNLSLEYLYEMIGDIDSTLEAVL